MLTYEMVVQATQGDTLAALTVLEHFDAYINRLCTHKVIYSDGHVEHGVDGDMKTYLQGCLLRAMLRFRV